MGRRVVITLLGAVACGTKTGESPPTHNPPAPVPEAPPAPAPAPVPPPAPAEERLLNPLDAQGRVILRARDGSCFVTLPPKEPPDTRLSFQPLPTEAVDCPTSMAAPEWEACVAGRVLAPADGGEGDCLCVVFGNPPPPPRKVACPKGDG